MAFFYQPIPDSSEIKPGMAHFEGSGPYGATCGDCIHRGYYRAGKNVFNEQTGMIEETRRKTLGCKEFLRLSHKHGPKVDADWKACRYFELKPPPPPPKPVKASDYDCKSISGIDLRDTILAIRRRRRFNSTSEGFLDSLLERAEQHETVFISLKRWRWLADLARRSKMGGNHA